VATYAGSIDGPDFKTRRSQLADLLLELVVVVEGVVANDDIVGEVECDFAFEKEVARDGFVVEPVEYGLEWVQAAVEYLEYFS
jgi:hypothetical protein